MRMRRRFERARPPRPQVRKLTADERDQLLGEMAEEIARSPVLSAFDVQVKALRGRFYLEWQYHSPEEPSERETRGRMTPLEDADGKLLLEVNYGKSNWSEFARGKSRPLIRHIAKDTKGTFHGLGSLDQSLRRAREAGVDDLPMKKAGKTKFVYKETDKICTPQEALYHYFKLPIPVIAEPRIWYQHHRTPRIIESSKDRTRVLVRFFASSLYGEFSGTCLYLNWEGEWGAYTIRPNQSDSIAAAEDWLVKRKWKPWT